MPSFFKYSLTRICFIIFWPVGIVYGLLMQARRFLFQKGVLFSETVDVPVISVGNLVLGGSGKTPLVMHLASLLQRNGYHPVIISRGYKGTATTPVNIVSDGHSIFLSAQEAGDEPYLLAENLQGIPVLTGKKRIFPAHYAVDTLHCDVIILDDAYQHLALHRDINLALFNCRTLRKDYRVFPGGLLREPLSALQQAQAVVFSNYDEKDNTAVSLFKKDISQYVHHNHFYCCQYRPSHLVDTQGATSPLSMLFQTESIAAFCAIAAPERFFSTISEMGIALSQSTAFSDHHSYIQNDLDNILTNAQEKKIDLLLTTEKDMVKLSHLSSSVPFYALSMELVCPKEFDTYILSSLQNRNRQE